MTSAADRHLKVLVVATNWWDLGGRIAILLRQAGFQVAEVSPPASIVHKIKCARSHYIYRAWRSVRSILDAIKNFAPDLIVCADDQSVVALHTIYARMRSNIDTGSPKIRKLIEQSLGDPQSYSLVASRSRFMAFAQLTGARCAETLSITSDSSFQYTLERANFPIAVKADSSFGGRGVRIAKNSRQAREFIDQLELAHSWPGAFMQIARDLTVSAVVNRVFGRRRTVSLQQFISGRDANRAVVCYRGKVLAGISVEALETRPNNGPATLVRSIEHPEMDETATELIQRLGLSGFCGFDFILDAENHAWLLEFNPRVTPASALPLDNETNLATALFATLASSQPPAKHKTAAEISRVFALYQGGEVRKSADSSCRIYPYHNPSWNEPEFLRASSVQRQANFVRAIQARLLDFAIARKIRGSPGS